MSTGFSRRQVFRFAAGALPVCARMAHAGVRLVLGHSYDPRSRQGLIMEGLARNLADQTSGAVEVEVVPAGRRGFESDLLQAVRSGNIELALVRSSLGNAVNVFKLFELPYLVRDRDHMERLFNQLIIPEMEPQARELGIEILAIIDGGFQQLLTSRPVRSPGDLKGLRIRTIASGSFNFFENLGAQPVRIPFDEIGPALSKKVINGVDISLDGILALRSNDATRFATETLPSVTLTNHSYSPIYLIAGRRALDRLDSESRSRLGTVSRVAMIRSLRDGETADRRNREELAKSVKILDVPSTEEILWIEIGRKSYDALARQLGGQYDLISRALRLGPKGWDRRSTNNTED